MTSNKFTDFIFYAILLACTSCMSTQPDPAGTDTTDGSGGSSLQLSPPTGDNVMTVSVNGSLCSSGSYINKPCVSVTVCKSGTTSCRTIDDILLDTGSYGLRIFKSAMGGLALTQEVSGSNSIAQCVDFADGSSFWGPVQVADVQLANEAAVKVPIQIIDSTFHQGSYDCGTPDASVEDGGVNGVLGVGLFDQDCGTKCTSSAGNGIYYACGSSGCTGTTLSLNFQVRNPVALLPVDNNGVIIQLPAVAAGGASAATGYMVLGIGTQSNNQIDSGVQTYAADASTGLMRTTFNGAALKSFLDTGTNALSFPSPSSGSLPNCGDTESDDDGWFCPSSTLSFSATNRSIAGSVSGVVSFSIGNFISLFSTVNNVFAEVGSDSGGTYFDWGLPFYYGRKIYHGLENKSSDLGSGPYWAY